MLKNARFRASLSSVVKLFRVSPLHLILSYATSPSRYNDVLVMIEENDVAIFDCVLFPF